MAVLTIHRRPTGDPAAVRIVSDGFRPSVFFLPPVALLARRLWVAAAVWLLLDGAAVALAAAGAVSGAAALAAIVVIHLAFAIDAADGERRQLARRGWPAVAILGPLGTAAGALSDTEAAAAGGPVAPPSPRAPGSTDVMGLFPTAPGSGSPDSPRS